MFALKEQSRLMEGVPGVPWRDLTDDEYQEASARVDAAFPESPPGALAQHFEHVPDETPAKTTKKAKE